MTSQPQIDAPAPAGAIGPTPGVFAEAKAHLDAAGESYWHHLYFCLRTAYSLIKTAVALVLHGLHPGIHKTTASERVIFLARRMTARRPDLNGSH